LAKASPKKVRTGRDLSVPSLEKLLRIEALFKSRGNSNCISCDGWPFFHGLKAVAIQFIFLVLDGPSSTA
jgi:hypothetical protein